MGTLPRRECKKWGGAEDGGSAFTRKDGAHEHFWAVIVIEPLVDIADERDGPVDGQEFLHRGSCLLELGGNLVGPVHVGRGGPSRSASGVEVDPGDDVVIDDRSESGATRKRACGPSYVEADPPRRSA